MFVNKNKLTLVFILKSELRTSVDVNKDHCSHVEEPICISHRRKFLPNRGLRLQAQTITGVGSSRTQSLFKNLAITFFFFLLLFPQSFPSYYRPHCAVGDGTV